MNSSTLILNNTNLEGTAMLRATSRLRDCRITFFTRSPCGLCDSAKDVVQKVKTQRPFTYQEINVMDPGQEKWKIYEFDTPVVRSEVCLCAVSEYLSVSRSTSTKPILLRPLHLH